MCSHDPDQRRKPGTSKIMKDLRDHDTGLLLELQVLCMWCGDWCDDISKY